MITVKEIYDQINSIAPFSAAESWDNCGILAGSPDAPVTKVLTTLDITKETVKEAEEKGAGLIVSHHPVIFHPLRTVLADTVTGLLLQKGISAVCVHTPFDMSPAGMAKGLLDILEKPLGLVRSSEEPLEVTGENLSIGKLYLLAEPLSPEKCAKLAKEALGCKYVRFTRGNKPISKIAVCSGSGGSVISLAMDKGANALISGDFKHDQFIDSLNSGFTLIDCGHFYTERIFANLMRDELSEAFPQLEISAADSCIDPVDYV
ncbi:MAG: Nif3-like dinuclear metal center hexameric protein [Ruminococcus sp.]|nr:Nif3-like dinuclear metal center hexameric protein [Ruminococcus sp.]